MQNTLGFIGLGIMGKPMATRLIQAGYSVNLFSRSGVPQDLQALGGIACPTIAELTNKSDIILIMVPDTPNVEAVLFGPAAVVSTLKPDQIVVDFSSISPVATRGFAESVEAVSAFYLDAPVSGGEVGAQQGTLSIMVGGQEAVFERVTPMLDVLGRNICHIGPNGTGQIAKIANQIIVALNIEAAAEALVFASKAGADPEKVRTALLGGFATSRVLELHAKRMIDRTFEPGFKVSLHRKDLRLALEAADQVGAVLPHTGSVQQLFASLSQTEGADPDHSALCLTLERLSNHELRPETRSAP